MSAVLGGCGLTVPKMQVLAPASDEKFDENDIVNQIKCELHKGLQETLAQYGQNGPYYGNSIDWIRKWGAKVTLTLTVDEKGGLNPGLTFFAPMANRVFTFNSGGPVTRAQNFTLGLGLQASADATRKEAIGFTYSFADLLAENPIRGKCDNENGILIHSDLKIGEFIENKAFVAKVPGSVTTAKAGESPYSTFSYEATFVVIFGGSVTPTWNLARLSANVASPFLNAVRTKTQDVIITLGPIDQPATPTKPPALTTEAQNAHLAALIGQAVAQAIQSQQP